MKGGLNYMFIHPKNKAHRHQLMLASKAGERRLAQAIMHSRAKARKIFR